MPMWLNSGGGASRMKGGLWWKQAVSFLLVLVLMLSGGAILQLGGAGVVVKLASSAAAGVKYASAVGTVAKIAESAKSDVKLFQEATKYEVGLAKNLRKTSQLFTEVNHVPQTAQARSLIGDFNLANKVGNEPSIRLVVSEHLKVNAAQAARPFVPASARELLAQDIRILRNSTRAPNSALQKLIQMNKELHPFDFTK